MIALADFYIQSLSPVILFFSTLFLFLISYSIRQIAIYFVFIFSGFVFLFALHYIAGCVYLPYSYYFASCISYTSCYRAFHLSFLLSLTSGDRSLQILGHLIVSFFYETAAYNDINYSHNFLTVSQL